MNPQEKLLTFPSEDSDQPPSIYTPIPKKTLCLLPNLTLQNSIQTYKERYKKAHSEYSQAGRTQIIVKRILSKAQLSRQFKNFPMEKILTDIIGELLMSELEIAVFSIYMNRFLWPDTPSMLIVVIYVLGLASKTYFLEEIEAVALHINEKIPNFIHFFNAWMTKNDLLAYVSLQELNKTFEELVRLPYRDLKVEYNFYVDSILENAPASVYEKPSWLEQPNLTIQEIECLPEQPVLGNMDSIFSIIGDFKELPLLAAGLSVASNGGFELLWDIR